MHDAQPGAWKPLFEQAVKSRPSCRDLGPRGAGAARIGVDVAKALEQSRQPFVDDARIENGHVRARTRGVALIAFRAQPRPAR
jgi:hypothetical protein